MPVQDVVLRVAAWNTVAGSDSVQAAESPACRNPMHAESRGDLGITVRGSLVKRHELVVLVLGVLVDEMARDVEVVGTLLVRARDHRSRLVLGSGRLESLRAAIWMLIVSSV